MSARPAPGGAASVATGTLRIGAVRLRCANASRSAAFYAAAFGCRPDGRAPATGRDADGARRLRLGDERVELVPTPRPGGRSAGSTSTAFQHFAIVVTDIGAAVARLGRVPGWRPISRGGPETLPAAAGGVAAFKFRDPDGHPLELLEFPAGAVPERWREAARRAPGRVCLGIDHSAIGVADTDRSIARYARLGFSVTERRVNAGAAQERLDDVDAARVEVTGLEPPGGAPPHLELLCYLAPGPRAARVPDGDRRATELVLLAACGVPTRGGPRARRDPDGHRLAFADGRQFRRRGRRG